MGQDGAGDEEWEGDLNLLYYLQTNQPARGEGRQGKEVAFPGREEAGAEGSVAGEGKDCSGEGGG